jgi:hypothetical protein
MAQPFQLGRRFPSAAVAGVWLYHGLWCKVLARCPDQQRVLEEVPLVRRAARPALVALGLAEVALAAWVAAGVRPRAAAATQTALVAGMNAGGLTWGRRHVAQPRALVAENAAFLALAWWAAASDRGRGG